MSGKLKTKGNMMLATKLDGVLKVTNLSLWTRGNLMVENSPTSSPQAAKAKAKL